MKQGHGFFVPHLTYTQILDDNNPIEREKGLEMGLTLLIRCDKLWDLNILGDHISKGMKTEIQFAQEHEIPFVLSPQKNECHRRNG